MKNKQIAELLYEMSELLSLSGDENRFRVIAYQRASQALESLSESIEELVAENKLKEVPGIGESIAEKVQEFISTGKIAALDELRAKFPKGLLEIMSIPGMGPKKAKIIFDKLHIKNIEQLKEAVAKEKIRVLPGFGITTEKNILKGISFKQRSKGRILLFDALRIANELLAKLSKFEGVRQVSLAGSLRRGRETIGDVDLLSAVEKGKEAAVIRRFTGLPEVERILAGGETKVSIVTEGEMQVDLRIVDPSVFGATLQYFTGSKDHNITLRGYARTKGYTISEYGIFKLKNKNVPIASRTEKEVYATLKMDYIPPEIREDQGEIQAALKGSLPSLVERKDIKGDIHVHSRYSDGANTIDELGEKARNMGYEWIICCDHSPSLAVARGLSVKDLHKKIIDVARFNSKSKDVHILCGAEVDILSDGKLDYSDETLRELDFVIASIHSGFKQSEQQITQRIISALRHPLVNCIAHPSGRLIDKRESYAVDMDQVIKEAKANAKLLEINASPDRLDLSDIYCRKAKDLGVQLAIGTDAHAIEQFDHIALGVTVARRGWLERGDLFNRLSYIEAKNYFEGMRKKALARI